MKSLKYFFGVIFILLFSGKTVLSNDIKGTTTNTNKLEVYGKVVSQNIHTENSLDASKRGITTSGILYNKYQVSDQVLPCIDNTAKKQEQQYKILGDFSDWEMVDSIFVNSFIPAGKNIGVKFNTLNKRLELINQNNELTETAKQAVEKSPKWLRLTLQNTLSLLTFALQDELAGLIINANDPIIDEIAFAIAYSSARFLSSSYCYPQMFVDNAQLIYSHDTDLQYVEIVDYGSSTTDENYYSTVKYWKIDSTRGKIQIEVPMDIYYMYIVHPKITDEISTYIDPDRVETNYQGYHINNIVAPPTGVFWRDYLYNHTELIPDTTDLYFPILKEEVSKCDVLWEDKKDSTNQAVRAVTKWVNDVMDFTSKEERPHQPIRIYDLHIGRCGEHEDLTAAAARACLIPCRGIEAMSIDHVWNEFWDEKWEQWEPVNNWYKIPLVYKDWGEGIGSTVSHRSDGVCLQETDRYVDEYSTYTFIAKDSKNQPIDGARIITYKKRTIDGNVYIFPDNYGITDNEGKYTFILGHGNTYYVRLESSLGNFPPTDNQVASFIENSVGGRHYDITLPPSNHPLSKTKTIIDINEVSPPEDNINDYVLKVNFTTEKQVIKWGLLWDDLGGCYTYLENDNGITNFFIKGNEIITKLYDDDSFDAFHTFINAKNGDVEFNIPKANDWFAYLNNGNSINNYQVVNGTFILYANPLTNIEEQNSDNNTNNYLYPNPFSNYANINFTLDNPSDVDLKIYNSNGVIVKTLKDALMPAGTHKIKWYGDNDNSEQLSNGIYYYQLNTRGMRITNKLVLIR